MSQKKLSQKRFAGGISSDSQKEGAAGQIPDMFYFGRAIDYRTDPQAITLLPKAVKESGSIVTDLLKFGDIVPTSLTSYFIGDTGKVYSRTSVGVWSNLFTVPSSHGNGLDYFTGDDYVYMTSDSNISRYGPTQNSPQFTANFLTAQGGVPTNTASILLASASSMYGHAADSASLSITGDLTLEAYFYANTLPTVGNSMTLIGKWDESGALRSYKLDLFGISGYFGDGSDSSLTVSSPKTDTPIDSACTGTSGASTLSATNASFVVGKPIFIHQTRGTNAGQWERNVIQGYTAGTITLQTPLKGTYTTGAQVIQLPQYTNVTVNSTWTAKAWNGTVGGIIVFLYNGTLSGSGSFSANACGFRGGAAADTSGYAYQGEGTGGAGTQTTVANGNGGGGGYKRAGGGSGGHATTGNPGLLGNDGGTVGAAGGTAGSADLTTMVFGGAGGGGGNSIGVSGRSGAGGNGGGIIYLMGVTYSFTGTITVAGQNGHNSIGSDGSGGGAGAAGSVRLDFQTAALGANLITALGATTGGNHDSGGNDGGGNASNGRIDANYLTSYTGTTNPTLNAVLDNTLVTTTTIQARLGISNDGTAYEYLTQNLSSLTTNAWNRLSVTWAASSSTALFYQNATLIGQSIGTKTSISDNTSLLYIGANKGASVVGNYFDGLLNDVRIINNVQSASQIFANLNVQLSSTYAGLQAYYKFNSAATDATANSNNLTLENSPTYSANVPFPNPTTRLDIDAQSALTGQTYTLPTSIIEDSANSLPFTPVNDPQNSVGFYVDTKGTGSWTVTVHDQQNRTIATKTITNANIPTAGFIEFIYASPWRILLNNSYHMHLTVSTGTSKVVTGTVSNFSTAEYKTFFGFLVPDLNFHPLMQFQYQPLGGTLTGCEVIGNERYLAIWDGVNYFPNFLTFPPGWKVRCFAQWRQYLAIGMWRGGNIYDFHQGRIYFWSGTQPAYDFFIDVPEGQINALFGIDSDLYIFAGYRGILLDYKGGFFYNTGNSMSNKLKRMPLLDGPDYAEVYPGALNMWRGLLHFGLYANSNSTTAEKGVYSYGTLNQYYPETLSYDYVISTGNISSSVSIGLVYPVGENLVIGWKDGIAYGADVVNFSNPYAPYGELQMLTFDNGNIWKSERSFQAKADFLPLNSGEQVAVKANINRTGWFTSDPATTATIGQDTFTKLIFNSGLSREVQIGVDLYSTGLTSPKLLGLSLLYDDTAEENAF